MPDEAAFIQTIREHPDDDGPRLVYADWLEERGECDRAEFIRVQIELARGVEDRKRVRQLRDRERQLLDKESMHWPPSLRHWVSQRCIRRGAIDLLALTAADFLAYGEAILSKQPVLELRLRAVGRHVDELANCPAFRLVGSLTLEVPTGSNGQWRRFFNSSFLSQLRSLSILNRTLTQATLGEVFRSTRLTNLRKLHAWTISGTLRLRSFPRLPKLVELSLSHNNLGNFRAAEVCECRLVEGIERLDLSNCEIDSDGAVALAGSGTFLPNLSCLDLSSNRIQNAGAIAIAASPDFQAMDNLNLARNQVGFRGALAVAQSVHFQGLRCLDLTGNNLANHQKARLRRILGDRVMV